MAAAVATSGNGSLHRTLTELRQLTGDSPGDLLVGRALNRAVELSTRQLGQHVEGQ